MFFLLFHPAENLPSAKKTGGFRHTGGRRGRQKPDGSAVAFNIGICDIRGGDDFDTGSMVQLGYVKNKINLLPQRGDYL